MATDAAWAARLEAWVAAAPDAGPVADVPAAVVFTLTATVAPTFRTAHLPEYRRRLLGIYAACAGWSRAAVAPLWPFVEAAARAFELGAEGPWRMALDELERRAGIGSPEAEGA